jgi:serine/threonine protein kinase
MDFGAGWDLLDPSASQRVVGTPVYLAPEVLAGNPPTPASDIYSLGVLLFFITTQQYPVAAATLEELHDRHARREQVQLRDLRPDLPSRFVEVVTRASALDAKDRFESCGPSRASAACDLVTRRRAIGHRAGRHRDSGAGQRRGAGPRASGRRSARRVRSGPAPAAGGMGEVYLARDTRLERDVALKVIAPGLAGDPDRLARFSREAKTASRLNHPSIAHIYEIGEANGVHFIAMEYVRGEELRLRIAGRGLPMSDVIIYATQIADALDEAHTHGVVHRDLKPSNAIVTTRGRIKVLDFGLAKTVGSPDRPEDGRSTEPGLTDVGLVLGTIDYMSPEQIRGLAVDRRSDIFSFGVMLYEMITGRLPFSGTSKTDLVFRITQAQPEPLSRYSYDVPPELDRIVRKCLEKEPARRYQSARDLLVDLSGLKRDSSSVTVAADAAPAAMGSRAVAMVIVTALAVVMAGAASAWYYWRTPDRIDSIAVLPDLRTGAGSEAAVVADAIANSIANSLSLTGSVRVAPRIRRGAGNATVDPLTEARDLGVHGALLITVEMRDRMAALDLRLVDVVHHPRQDWGQQYKIPVSEIDLAQEHIAAEVAETLNLRFDAEQRRALKAYQLYQRGRSYLPQRTENDLRRAIEFFQLAIDTDGDYARAWAGLAQARNLLHLYSIVKPAEIAPAAKAAAEKALALDDQLGAAHTQRALVSFRWEWNWREAAKGFARAVSLDNHDTDARHWAAMFETAEGRFDEAMRLVREAQAIDPLESSGPDRPRLGLVHGPSL